MAICKYFCCTIMKSSPTSTYRLKGISVDNRQEIVFVITGDTGLMTVGGISNITSRFCYGPFKVNLNL